MGTWDVGPFDNDTAAEFSGDLDQAPAGDREGLIGTLSSAPSAPTTTRTSHNERRSTPGRRGCP